MTDAGSDPAGGLIGVSIWGRISQFPGLAIERVWMLADIDRALVADLRAAAEASAFFTRANPVGPVPVRPDMRI